MKECKTIGCHTPLPTTDISEYCIRCTMTRNNLGLVTYPQDVPAKSDQARSQKYPKYFKDVSSLKEIDIYAVHKLFQIEDCSGALQHASKKLLLSGVRTGGKSKYQDIKEARDTLNRWLEINANQKPEE